MPRKNVEKPRVGSWLVTVSVTTTRRYSTDDCAEVDIDDDTLWNLVDDEGDFLETTDWEILDIEPNE